MAVLVEYVGTFVRELIFFSGDVKTTAIAIAVTSSMCCSVVWLLINLLSSDTNHQPAQVKSYDASQRNSLVSYHLSKKINSVEKQRRKSCPGINLTVNKSLWTGRVLEKGCTVPCIRCGNKNADKLCRYVLCKHCCKRNLATICGYHGNINSHKHETRDDTCQLKPKQMNLSFLNLARCPDRVGYVGPQLLRLNLSNNCLLSVPVEIGFLLGLQFLDLHNNQLTKLPESIRNLRNLKELDVCQNKLRVLPTSIGHLCCLQILKLNRNRLHSIPSAVGQLKELLQFKACNNLLKYIPAEISCLSKLEVLQVHCNKLVELPANMSEMIRLTELDVTDNKLISLPNDITKCAFLSCLKAAQNRLTELPSHMNRLQDLRVLYVSNNRLRYLPASIHSLQLVMLNIHKNPLWKEDQIPSTEFTSSSPTESEFPTLVEVSARKIIAQCIPWRKQNLPLVLQDVLSRVHHCSSCERPLLDTGRTKLEYRSCLNMSHKLPLYQMICPPLYSSKCDFMKLQCDM